jgi:hypothetical protein
MRTLMDTWDTLRIHSKSFSLICQNAHVGKAEQIRLSGIDKVQENYQKNPIVSNSSLEEMKGVDIYNL